MSLSPERQLAGFIAKFTPDIAARARAVLTKMRARLPNASELVYDNYYALVVGFGPTQRPSEAIFSIVVYPRRVSLCFLRGTNVPDPQKLLRGSGKQVRHIVLASERTLDEPGVRLLMDLAMHEWAEVPSAPPPARVIIRAVAERQHPRRPQTEGRARKASIRARH